MWDGAGRRHADPDRQPRRDGTGTTNFNAKHKNRRWAQIAAFRDGTLADVSVPVRGSRHDSRALDEVGWADQITAARTQRVVAVLADSADVKHTRLTPRKKTTGIPRTTQDKVWNRHIASLRAPVERAIALLNQWKILSAGYRCRLTELPSIIHIVTNLEFYRLTH